MPDLKSTTAITPIPLTPIRLYDNSRISDFRRCPRYYLFRHIYDWAPDTKAIALTFGSSWHAAMDVVWTNHKAPEKEFPDVVDQAYAVFVTTWTEGGLPHPDNLSIDDLDELGARTPQNAQEMLYNYLDARQHIFTDPSFTLIDIEQPFAVPLDPKDSTLWYVGRLDKVFEYRRKVIVGEHKCLGAGTLVMKFDGTCVPVESLRDGDLLMGPDSSPRRITSMCTGTQELFQITPVKGTPYIVNKAHVLSLRMTNHGTTFVCGNEKFPPKSIANVNVGDYLESKKGFKDNAYGWRPDQIDFCQILPPHPHLPPYILGAWLGDGTSSGPAITSRDPEVVREFEEYVIYRDLKLRKTLPSKKCPTYTVVTKGEGKGRNYIKGERPINHLLKALQSFNLLNNKHVPHVYKTGSRETRLEVLAGFIDTDGSLQPNGGGGYRISQKSRQVCEDICFIARSLGLAAYIYETTSKTQTGVLGRYYWVYLSGPCHSIPCRIAKKRAPLKTPPKNVCNVGIKSVESVGPGRYYGFELEGPDRLFLLGDFTVTHNTSSAYKKDGPFRNDFLDSFSISSQIDGYNYRLKMDYPDRSAGVWVDAALVHKTVHDGFKFIPVDRPDHMIDGWLWEAHFWIGEIEKNLELYHERKDLDIPYLAAFPKNTGSCSNYGGCAFADICRTVANPAKLSGPPLGYKIEHWSPFKEIALEKIGFTPERAGELREGIAQDVQESRKDD